MPWYSTKEMEKFICSAWSSRSYTKRRFYVPKVRSSKAVISLDIIRDFDAKVLFPTGFTADQRLHYTGAPDVSQCRASADARQTWADSCLTSKRPCHMCPSSTSPPAGIRQCLGHSAEYSRTAFKGKTDDCDGGSQLTFYSHFVPLTPLAIHWQLTCLQIRPRVHWYFSLDVR